VKGQALREGERENKSTVSWLHFGGAVPRDLDIDRIRNTNTVPRPRVEESKGRERKRKKEIRLTNTPTESAFIPINTKKWGKERNCGPQKPWGKSSDARLRSRSKKKN